MDEVIYALLIPWIGDIKSLMRRNIRIVGEQGPTMYNKGRGKYITYVVVDSTPYK
jgi:hypothetical protein|uniref:Uncharacterized protein n=1 Tax=Picea glauca TaxID=3330 RepID=A0A101LV71_PICGL|nr:hypothetical protein ABT39_MTgene2043 [Picea glauca]QHR89633.1 hypothetical protein Q903MT_gene3655 [Picea sitchensis]